MASGQVDRINNIYDIPALTAQQKQVEDLVKKTVAQIKAARKESIEFNVGTKSFDDYNKKIKELEKTLAGMQKASNEATKASILLAKQKEAEAKATLAQTKATEAQTKAQASATKATEAQAKAQAQANATATTNASILLAKQKEAEAKATLAQIKATEAQTKAQASATKATEAQAKAQANATAKAQAASRPYQQLATAFQIAAKHAQDLAAKYGIQDKRAQDAARSANALNDKLKAIDDTVGISNRRVGSYSEALEGFSNKLKNVGTSILAVVGIAGIGSLFQDSIDEFISMDKNVRILQNTLRNQGVESAFDRIEASAKKLAKQFSYLDDDDILSVFNQLLVYGKLTEDQLNELIPVIIDFAAATGQDLGSATSTIIKALEGNGKALKEYGINIKDAKSTSEAFGLIMTELAPKVAGVGKAFGDSAAGGLASAQQRFKDLKEEIGTGLLPILNSVLSSLIKITNAAVGGTKALLAFNKTGNPNDFIVSAVEDSFDTNESLQKAVQSSVKANENFINSSIKDLKKLQQEGKKLQYDEDSIRREYLNTILKRNEDFQQRLDKLRKSGSIAEVQTLLVDYKADLITISNLKRQLDGDIKPTGDADKPFTEKSTKAKTAKDEQDYLAQIKRDNIELDKEFDLILFNNEKKSYEERLTGLIAFGNDSQRLIEFNYEAEIEKEDGNKEKILKITNDKNNALIRLSQDLADKLAKITAKSFEVDTSKIADGIKGLPAEIQKALDDYKKAQEKAIKDHEAGLKELKKNTKDAVIDLASQLEGLFFDIFTNAIERQKNAIQDQIDLLEAQKQKDIEVANATITNASDRADAIAVIEARAAAKKQQLEIKQRLLDQQKARFEKARTIAEIAQSTALAVVNALTQVKTLGPGAIALAAVIGAIGALQIARALATPIPRYKDGTDNHKGGLAIVGDGGKSEGIQLPDGTVYKTPSTATVVDMPKGSKVYKDYSNMKVAASGELQVFDTRAELKQGFSQVVAAVKRIPQPIIRAERAWTQAHKTGSNFRNRLNKAL